VFLVALKHSGCGGRLDLLATDEDFWYFLCRRCRKQVRYTNLYMKRFDPAPSESGLVPVQITCAGCGQERGVYYVDPKRLGDFHPSCTNCGPLRPDSRTGRWEPYD